MDKRTNMDIYCQTISNMGTKRPTGQGPVLIQKTKCFDKYPSTTDRNLSPTHVELSLQIFKDVVDLWQSWTQYLCKSLKIEAKNLEDDKDPSLKIFKMLCESWRSSESLKSWRYHLVFSQLLKNNWFSPTILFMLVFSLWAFSKMCLISWRFFKYVQD